ncbi:MSC_0882 family membrane protein [Mycoplasma nasistruthionis]|uniref:Uncharacterized protein n=1 Tax=Mycoplasma nasistruthionis TaxID=353852 RepID=A0A4Y6I6X7_9MOLU|nr:hypothetical protein [Mycoplasma nasistruthionis]QDF65131.1 hypothetical protein FIV53_02430 [Mycoplasma nasistruthionis]
MNPENQNFNNNPNNNNFNNNQNQNFNPNYTNQYQQPQYNQFQVAQQFTAQVPSGINTSMNNVNYQADPKGELPKALYNTFKRERRISLIAMLFWLSVLLISIAGIIATYLVCRFSLQNDQNKGIIYYLFSSVLLLISLIYTVKSSIKRTSWKRGEQKTRDDYAKGNISSISVFQDTYRSLSFKMLRLNWILAFFLTYFGLFTIIITILYNQSTPWQIGHKPVDNSSFSFFIELKWPEVLNNGFGNTKLLLILSTVFIGIVCVLFTLVRVFDLKRIAEIKENLGADSATIINAVATEKKSENKAWIKSYTIVFIIVVLIPLILFIYLVWRGIIRRGKK